MRDIIVIGFMIAAVLILIRIILGSPLVTRVRESFIDLPASINSSTECPGGTKQYMHDGTTYCCSGTVSESAGKLKDSCKASSGRDEVLTFCTLGPSNEAEGVPNCLAIRAELMAAEGATICPRDMTYVKGSGDLRGKCCIGTANPAFTECADAATPACVVIAGDNEFVDEKSCQFMRAQQNTVCPSNQSPFVAPGQGAMSNLKLFGCTDGAQNCYADSTLKRLKELGYSVDGLPVCR